MKPREHFFVQRMLELLHRETVDTYRVKVLNPKLALEELIDVYDGLTAGRIKRFEDLEYCCTETLSLLKKDDTIRFDSIEKGFFTDQLLRRITNTDYREFYPRVRTAIKTILSENKDYLHSVIHLLEVSLQKEEERDPFPGLDELNRLCGILATELLEKGYTKNFLHSFCHSIFVKKFDGFDKGFKKLIDFANSPDTHYRVWFKVYSPAVDSSKWDLFPSWDITEEVIDNASLPSRVQRFLSAKRNYHFLGRELAAPDHYSALQRSKQELAEFFDLIRLAHHNAQIDLSPNAVVFPVDRPHLAGLPKVQHIPDGKFPDGNGVLHILQQKTAQILNQKIDPETKEKIKSAIRYLRFGHEAVELEHQLINYWIGLEYLFSNERDSTFTRIKTIFPTLHTLVYLQRNLKDFHQAIIQRDLAGGTRHFEPGRIDCMLQESCLESIRDDHYQDFPLLSYRAWRFKNKILKKGIKIYLNQHQKHLVWHLARIYRARNLIIHEAKHSFVNQTLTSNLRYYLTFSLSFLMDYFAENDLEARNLQEFFALQQLRLDSLAHAQYPPEKLIAFNHQFDFLA